MREKPFSNSSVFVALSQKEDGDMSLDLQGEAAEGSKKNRRKFFESLGVDSSDTVFANLAHGNNLEIVHSSDRGEVISNSDGLLTQEPNLYLAFTVADCLPVFLFEPDLGLIGLIHCGWQGLALDILCKTCGKIEDNWGKALENLRIFLGPGICKEHFEIGKDVAKYFSSYSQALFKEEGKIYLSLKEVALKQLLDFGLREENIQASRECTYKFSDEYFSYRRGDSERMLALIGFRA